MINDDLQQFKKLLEENNKQLEQNFQNRLEANNKQLRLEVREDVKAEVDPLHERMDTQYKNLTGQINAVKAEITHDVANLVSDSLLPLFDEQEAKITELQKAVGLRPKH